jgi:PAS domain S-box-containing protein
MPWSSVPPATIGEDLRLVLDDITDYAVFVVSLDGRIASWNAGAARLKGYSAEEAVGQPFAMLFPPEDAARGDPGREMQEALEKGVFHGHGKRRRKDGTLFDAEVTLRLLHHASGAPRGFVKVTRDVSERRRAEALEQERADFERELVGIVSHDLKGPLQTILFAAASLRRQPPLEAAKQAQVLERLSAAASRCARMVSDLLDFTQVRLGGGLKTDLEPVALHALAREVVGEVLLAHPGRQVEVEAHGDGAGAWDPDRLSQLLTNLLRNALTYGDASRPVRVTTRGEEGAVALEVHSWGPPIPAQLMPSLFERLTRGGGKGEPGSIGLGLFIVRSITRAHGGAVEVRPTAEEGTTFRVVLPRMPPGQTPPGAPSRH